MKWTIVQVTKQQWRMVISNISDPHGSIEKTMRTESVYTALHTHTA